MFCAEYFAKILRGLLTRLFTKTAYPLTGERELSMMTKSVAKSCMLQCWKTWNGDREPRLSNKVLVCCLLLAFADNFSMTNWKSVRKNVPVMGFEPRSSSCLQGVKVTFVAAAERSSSCLQGAKMTFMTAAERSSSCLQGESDLCRQLDGYTRPIQALVCSIPHSPRIETGLAIVLSQNYSVTFYSLERSCPTFKPQSLVTWIVIKIQKPSPLAI